jgi:hypothetical protein
MPFSVMAGLIPAIHVVRLGEAPQAFADRAPTVSETAAPLDDVDGRDNPRIKSGDGHDAEGTSHTSASAERRCGTRNVDVIDTFSVDPRCHSDGVDSGADDHGKSGDAE